MMFSLSFMQYYEFQARIFSKLMIFRYKWILIPYYNITNNKLYQLICKKLLIITEKLINIIKKNLSS